MNDILDRATGEDSELGNMMGNGSFQKAASFAYTMASEMNVPDEMVGINCNVVNLEFQLMSMSHFHC